MIFCKWANISTMYIYFLNYEVHQLLVAFNIDVWLAVESVSWSWWSTWCSKILVKCLVTVSFSNMWKSSGIWSSFFLVRQHFIAYLTIWKDVVAVNLNDNTFYKTGHFEVKYYWQLSLQYQSHIQYDCCLQHQNQLGPG